MRLLHVPSVLAEEDPRLLFEDFFKDIPSYGILSHRWFRQEVTYQHALSIPLGEILEDPLLAPSASKIINFCRIVQEWQKDYAWVDTCCIDKTNLVELSETITSMFRWYRQSDVCIVYMPDVKSSDSPRKSEQARQRFVASEWFRRGWTLQELLASNTLQFYSKNWSFIGPLRHLSAVISEATSIPVAQIRRFDPVQDSVAEKMRWVSQRLTSREEDMAYCLFGLFDVSIDIRYGEGLARAFRRLQEAILIGGTDETIFVWRSKNYLASGLLAPHPHCFRESRLISSSEPIGSNGQLARETPRREIRMTSRGLQVPVSPESFIYTPSVSEVLLWTTAEAIYGACIDCIRSLDDLGAFDQIIPRPVLRTLSLGLKTLVLSMFLLLRLVLWFAISMSRLWYAIRPSRLGESFDNVRIDWRPQHRLQRGDALLFLSAWNADHEIKRHDWFDMQCHRGQAFAVQLRQSPSGEWTRTDCASLIIVEWPLRVMTSSSPQQVIYVSHESQRSFTSLNTQTRTVVVPHPRHTVFLTWPGVPSVYLSLILTMLLYGLDSSSEGAIPWAAVPFRMIFGLTCFVIFRSDAIGDSITPKVVFLVMLVLALDSIDQRHRASVCARWC